MKAENEPEGYQWNGREYILIPDVNQDVLWAPCAECDLYETDGCIPAPCRKGIFKLKQS